MKNIVIAVIVLVVLGLGFYYMTSKNSLSNISTGAVVDNSPNLPANTPPLDKGITSVSSSTTSKTSPNTSPNTLPKTSPNTSPDIFVSDTVVNVTVEIKNFSFSPSALTFKTGSKVTWVNNDSVPHTVTSDAGNILNSPTLLPGESYSFTFVDSVGSLSYHCNLHKTMKGRIVITE